MDQGNVLVIGNSGVGKSTLINSILGQNVAKTSRGSVGTTERLEIYESGELPFCIIDSVGFEPSFIKRKRAINAVKKWSKESAKDGHGEKQINIIWFCVDGTTSKLFPQTIESMLKATAMWKSVPIIVVITKSYSEPEREQNIDMVKKAFELNKNYSKNLRKIIPVVAERYEINDFAAAEPYGLEELINVTNELMPEGIKAAEYDVGQFVLDRKRVFAQITVSASTAAAITVGAVPIPIADAAILTPVEAAEINGIAAIYDINNGEGSKKIINTIVEVGTVSAVAKALISAIKAIPGINIVAGVLNAVIAGSIVAVLGEASIYIFEKIYLGEKNLDDIDWATKVVESRLSKNIANVISEAIEDGQLKDGISKKEIGKIITRIFNRTKQKK